MSQLFVGVMVIRRKIIKLEVIRMLRQISLLVKAASIILPTDQSPQDLPFLRVGGSIQFLLIFALCTSEIIWESD